MYCATQWNCSNRNRKLTIRSNSNRKLTYEGDKGIIPLAVPCASALLLRKCPWVDYQLIPSRDYGLHFSIPYNLSLGRVLWVWLSDPLGEWLKCIKINNPSDSICKALETSLYLCLSGGLGKFCQSIRPLGNASRGSTCPLGTSLWPSLPSKPRRLVSGMLTQIRWQVNWQWAS